MWRKIGAVLAGLVVWIVVVSLLNRGLRLWLPGYAAVEQAMTFTLTMKIARLAIAALSSLAAGAVTRAIAPASNWAPWIVGLVLVALFVPEHIHIWNRFPIWYHLTFLLTLAPLVWLGARLLPRKKPA
ncbi:MAG TPA: hypothetical protein VGL66_13070 [Caulobacteraceae bacterium]|jgi:hypothetical protein